MAIHSHRDSQYNFPEKQNIFFWSKNTFGKGVIAVIIFLESKALITAIFYSLSSQLF